MITLRNDFHYTTAPAGGIELQELSDGSRLVVEVTS